MTTRRLGIAEVLYLGKFEVTLDRDFAGSPCAAIIQRYRISLSAEPALIAEWTMWKRAAGDGAVRVKWLEGREAEGCPRHYHEIGVYPHPDKGTASVDRVMMLRLVKPKMGKPHESSLQITTLEEIARASGVPDPESVLRSWGATRVGCRGDLGWHALRKDGHLAVEFPTHSLWVPTAVLLLCVVLPRHGRRGTPG